MALADDIDLLRTRTLAELNEAMTYYDGSRLAWSLLRREVNAGWTFDLLQTGTKNIIPLAELNQKSKLFLERYLIESSFLKFIAIAEAYLLVNPTFVAKVRGPYPLQFPLGYRVELTEPYHQDVWDLLRRIVAETAEAVRTRA